MCSGYLLTSPSKLSTNPCHPCRLSTFAPIGLHFAILALAHFLSSKIEDMDPKERCRTDDKHDDSSYTEGSCILQSYLLDNSPLHMTSRTALQTLQYVICSDCFWHRLTSCFCLPELLQYLTNQTQTGCTTGGSIDGLQCTNLPAESSDWRLLLFLLSIWLAK